jgi:hypothetical protein
MRYYRFSSGSDLRVLVKTFEMNSNTKRSNKNSTTLPLLKIKTNSGGCHICLIPQATSNAAK